MFEIIAYVTFSIAFLAIAIPLWIMMFCLVACCSTIYNVATGIQSATKAMRNNEPEKQQ